MNCLECQQLLSPYEKGELPADDASSVAAHVESCSNCSQRLDALRQLDDLLRAVPSEPPAASTLLAVRDQVHHQWVGGEIMDVDQVAAYLKLSREQVMESLDELPCFEVAGQIRFRRAAILEWIEDREKARRREVLRARVAGENMADIAGPHDVMTLDI